MGGTKAIASSENPLPKVLKLKQWVELEEFDSKIEELEGITDDIREN